VGIRSGSSESSMEVSFIGDVEIKKQVSLFP
jgi:hypothetical protein